MTSSAESSPRTKKVFTSAMTKAIWKGPVPSRLVQQCPSKNNHMKEK